MSSTKQALLQRIESREVVVGVVGLGYVGLPLALTFARKGIRVVGFDIDPTKIEAIEAGRSYLDHLKASDLQDLVTQGTLRATTDFARAAECDALLLCVPTPLTEHRDPDMSFIRATAEALAPHLRPAQIVILESTTYPGTTDELLATVLNEGSSVTVGQELLLAYSPEREDPGNPDYNTARIPKLVGGVDDDALEVALALYRLALDEVVAVSSARVAELAKIYENVFRSVNIALVNELKLLCEKMEIDVWEVIDAAATKPFGFMRFTPGPGLGGHCIPIDPFYLSWKAREYGLSTRFIELAGEINSAMPAHVVDRCAQGLNDAGKPMKGARILVLGVAYKKDVDDLRESPALTILELLAARGAKASYHDPRIPRIGKTRRHAFDEASIPLTAKTLASCDAVVIVTDHSEVDYALVASHAPLVIDTRDVMAGVPGAARVLKA